MVMQPNPHSHRPESDPEPSTVAATIARVAARLFAERGFDATSIREIATASGVTKPTLYYHFGSKQGLGEAILTRPMADLADQLTRLAASDPAPAGPIHLLVAMFQVHFDFVVADPDRSRFVLAVCFGPADSSFGSEVERFGVVFHQSLLDATGKLAAAGLIAPARVEACAQICRGLVMTSTLDHIFHGKALPDGLAERLVHDLLNGFARPVESFTERQGSVR